MAVGSALQSRLGLLRGRASQHSIYGAGIATTAVLIALAVSGWMQSGEIGVASMILAHRTNPAIWLLYAMPFVFACWGQYVGAMLARDVGHIVTDQTRELREKTEALEHKAAHDATHDHLTDLPNRILLRDRIDQALRSVARTQQPLAWTVTVRDA